MIYTEEKHIIGIKRYRDEQGNPCCAGDFKKGKVCQFYMTSNFGTKETCYFSEGTLSLERRDEGLGSLIPCKECPVWGNEV